MEGPKYLSATQFSYEKQQLKLTVSFVTQIIYVV